MRELTKDEMAEIRGGNDCVRSTITTFGTAALFVAFGPVAFVGAVATSGLLLYSFYGMLEDCMEMYMS